MLLDFGYTDEMPRSEWVKKIVQPYERLGFIPGFDTKFSDKDRFLKTFREYADKDMTDRSDSNRNNKNPIWFLPKGYRVTQNKKDREALRDLLKDEGGGGMDLPWVLKKTDVDNGLGVQMLAPHSNELKGLLKRLEEMDDGDVKNDYIVQQYICNELTWFEGQKFDLRMVRYLFGILRWVIFVVYTHTIIPSTVLLCRKCGSIGCSL
ncbi:MAG: hypothetical protein SGARI_006252 [Bacillariaceae sp.]